MAPTFSFFSRLLDTIAPRACVVCGSRLSLSEDFICGPCNRHLPRTNCAEDFYHNILAQRFWGVIPIEKAFALIYYGAKANPSNLIYQLKYHKNAPLGRKMGEFIAKELAKTDFFSGINALIPLPLTPGRMRQRGFNQSMQLAHGIADVTHIKIIDNAVCRTHFNGSQTRKSRFERSENVKNAFALVDAEPLKGEHVLLIDDIVTTGATMLSFAQEVAKAENVKISILSWGMTKL